jgi:protein-disulfide isomerase
MSKTPPSSPTSSEIAIPSTERHARDKTSPLFFALLPVLFVLGLGSGYLLWGGKSSAPAVAQAISATQTASAQAEAQQNFRRYDVPTDDDPAIGLANAPITIVEFSDYQCPYCLQWHQQVFNQLRQDYPDKVRFVYRDFPLTSIHPEAGPAAEAANCANDQGAFWPYHDKLFSGQYALSEQAYKQYASDLGLDQGRFADCLSSHRYANEVQADFDFASSLGIRSTPTFFVNGIAVVGAQPYNVFKQVIDKELAGEFPK